MTQSVRTRRHTCAVMPGENNSDGTPWQVQRKGKLGHNQLINIIELSEDENSVADPVFDELGEQAYCENKGQRYSWVVE